MLALGCGGHQSNVNGQKDGAIEVAIKGEDRAVDEMFQEALRLRREREHEAAIAQFQLILLQYPNTDQKPRIKLYMGTLYSQIQQYGKAIELYKQIQTESPDYQGMATVLYHLALAYRWSKNSSLAVATYDQIIKQWPHDDIATQALYSKGKHYYYQKQFDQARTIFRQIVDDEQKQEKWRLLAIKQIGLSYFKADEYQQAVSIFEEKLRRFGDDAYAVHMIAEAYRREAQYPEAIAAFKRILREHPDYREAHVAAYFIGECLEIQGNLQAATRAYQEAISKYPEVAPESRNRIQKIEQGQDPLSPTKPTPTK
jgi:tetratricopeptide (TPR) repeat protein